MINLVAVRASLKRLDALALRYPHLTDLEADRGALAAAWITDIEEMMSEPKLFYTVKELAEILQVHKNQIRNWIKDGRLRAGKIGRSYRISAADLEAYYQSIGGGSLYRDTPAEKTEAKEGESK